MWRAMKVIWHLKKNVTSFEKQINIQTKENQQNPCQLSGIYLGDYIFPVFGGKAFYFITDYWYMDKVLLRNGTGQLARLNYGKIEKV